MIKWLDENLEEALLAMLLCGMALVMGIQVFSRYALGSSLSWSEELTRYMFIWSAFLSISYCTKRCISIKIEQFIHLFSEKNQAVLKLINHTIELGLFSYLIPYSVMYLSSSITSGQVSPALGIPMCLVQSAPLAGFSLAFIRIVQRWIAELRTIRSCKGSTMSKGGN